MGQAFDPYHKWLGIPPEEQPANHYRLLGIQDFEEDPDVVQSAADQRMAHLRTYQTGRYADWSQRLLNEVAAAKICLLNPAKKAAYDEHLRETKQSQSPQVQPALDHPFDVVADEPRPRASSALLAKRRMPVTAIITGVVTLCVVLAAALVYLNSEPPENVGIVPSQSPDQTTAMSAASAHAPAEPKPQPKLPVPHGKAKADNRTEHGEETATTELPPLEPRVFPVPDIAGGGEKPTAKPKLSLNTDAGPGLAPKAQESREPEPSTPTRAVTPAANEQDEAMKLARDLYRSDFTKAKTPEEKQAMAKRLLGQATAAAKADAGAFVLFRLARDISTQASDMETALAAIDAMSERFQIDVWETKLEAMLACSKKGRTPPQHLAVAEQALRLADEAAAAGSYPQAVGLAKLAIAEAGSARNKDLVLTAKTTLSDLQRKARLAKTDRETTTVRATARPTVPMGKWFSLLPSPNELTGWDVKGCNFNYVNRIIELRGQSMYCPIVAKDATIRAKVRRHGSPRIRMILRESSLGCYIAQVTGGDCQIIKLTRNVPPGQQASAMMHGPGSENTLSRVPIPRTPNDVVFEMSFAAAGNTLTVFLNRQPVAQAKDTALPDGMVGIGTDNADGLYFTDIELVIPKGSLVADHR